MSIDKFAKKRKIFSNEVGSIRKRNNKLKAILKECRCNRNKVDLRLEDKINMFCIYMLSSVMFGLERK